MKKSILLLVSIIMILFVTSCGANGAKSALNDIYKIVEMKISSTMTEDEPVLEKVVSQEHAVMILEKLKEYSYSEREQEKQKGWQYYFLIRYQDKDKKEKEIGIGLIDDLANIDGVEYTVKNYSPDDFKDIS